MLGNSPPSQTAPKSQLFTHSQVPVSLPTPGFLNPSRLPSICPSALLHGANPLFYSLFLTRRESPFFIHYF
jgi:hypothetical protein